MKNLTKIFFFLAIMLPNLVLAADTAPANVNSFIQSIFELVTILMTLLQVLIWPVLLMIGALFGNDLIFSGGMGSTLLSIWTVVRDFVNIFIVLILLGVATMNIFGMAKDDMLVKAFLPRLAIALIAVNFSYLGAKIFLDITNVATTAIFALPLNFNSVPSAVKPSGSTAPAPLDDFGAKLCDSFRQVATATTGKTTEQPKGPAAQANTGSAQPGKATGAVTSTGAPTGAATGGTATTPPANKDVTNIFDNFCSDGNDPKNTNIFQKAEKNPGILKDVKLVLNDAGKAFFAQFNQRNVAMIMALDMMQFSELPKLNVNSVNDLKGLTIGVIYSLIFTGIYSAAFIALFVALLVRVAILWITIAVSPLVFLGIAYPKIKSSTYEGDEAIWPMFKSNAMLTVRIAAVLSLGVMMFNAFKGLRSGVFGSKLESFNLLSGNLSVFQDLIVGIGMVVFIWKALTMSFKDSTGGKMGASILGFAEGFGKSLAKAPLSVPIIPVMKDGKVVNVGLGALKPAFQALESKIGEGTRRDSDIFGDHSKAQRQEQLMSLKNNNDVRSNLASRYAEGMRNPESQQEFQKNIAAYFEANKDKIRDFRLNTSDVQNLKAGTLNESQFRAILNRMGVTPEAAVVEKAAVAANSPGLQDDLKAQMASLVKDGRSQTQSGDPVKAELLQKIQHLETLIQNREQYKLDRLRQDPSSAATKINELVEQLKKAGIDNASKQEKIVVELIGGDPQKAKSVYVASTQNQSPAAVEAALK